MVMTWSGLTAGSGPGDDVAAFAAGAAEEGVSAEAAVGVSVAFASVSDERPLAVGFNIWFRRAACPYARSGRPSFVR